MNGQTISITKIMEVFEVYTASAPAPQPLMKLLPKALKMSLWSIVQLGQASLCEGRDVFRQEKILLR